MAVMEQMKQFIWTNPQRRILVCDGAQIEEINPGDFRVTIYKDYKRIMDGHFFGLLGAKRAAETQLMRLESSTRVVGNVKQENVWLPLVSLDPKYFVRFNFLHKAQESTAASCGIFNYLAFRKHYSGFHRSGFR